MQSARIPLNADNTRLEIRSYTPDIDEEKGVGVLHFGASTTARFGISLTPDEAESLASNLIRAARVTREAFKKVNV